MRKANQFLLLLIVAVAGQLVTAQKLVNKPVTMVSLNESWEWALQQLNEEGTAWVAYGFNVQLDERFKVALSSQTQDYIEWNRASNNGWRGNWYNNARGGWHNRLSLFALQSGITTAQQDYPVEQDLLLLARFENGSPSEIRIVASDTLIDWNAEEVFWLGNFTQEESFRLQLGLLSQLKELPLQRVLLRGIGLHDNPDRDAALIAVANDQENPMLHFAAVESLAIRKSVTAESALAETARDENAELTARRIAISALSRYNSNTSQRLLGELAGNRNPQAIRREAVESLSLLDSDASTEILADIVALDENRSVVMEAIRGLSRDIQHFTTLAAVAENHSDSDIREHAMEIVAAMDGARAFPLLKRLFQADPSSDLKEGVLDAMGKVPGDVAVPFLLDVANGNAEYDDDLRAEAVDSLAAFEASLVLDDLNLLAWSDSNEDVRGNAVKAIAELTAPTVNTLLLEIARNHPSTHTRREAMDELEDRVF